MIRGLYSAASAMDALTLRQDAIAQNLAHVNMPGFRRHLVTFESVGMLGDLRGTRATEHTNHASGPLITTGNPLDLALSHNGFFVLNGGPQGLVYTRNGTFRVNGQGQIVSHAESPGFNPGDGPSLLPLMGEDGPIIIPANTVQITVLADGTVVADEVVVDQVQVRRFTNQQRNRLTRVGTTLFQTPPGIDPLPVDAVPVPGVLATDPEAIPPRDEVLSGHREGSNVNGVGQLVEMLSSLRQFEASQRALRALGESIRLRTQPQ